MQSLQHSSYRIGGFAPLVTSFDIMTPQLHEQ